VLSTVAQATAAHLCTPEVHGSQGSKSLLSCCVPREETGQKPTCIKTLLQMFCCLKTNVQVFLVNLLFKTGLNDKQIQQTISVGGHELHP